MDRLCVHVLKYNINFFIYPANTFMVVTPIYLLGLYYLCGTMEIYFLTVIVLESKSSHL